MLFFSSGFEVCVKACKITVVTCHLPFAKQNSKCLKINSFKNVRELLLLSYVNNVSSDREFVLLYDAYQSKNPDFNYQQYDPFNLDDM